MAKVERYGVIWQDMDDLQIELDLIRKGGTVKLSNGRIVGEGLFQHYKNAQSLLWPSDDHHRWSDLILKRALENDILTIMGAGDSSKTFTLSKFALVDWWAYPSETLWLITSTEYRGSELRIWGALKELYNRAIDNFEWLEGRVLEGMHAITSDKIDDDQRRARSLRQGLVFVPCFVSGTLVDTLTGQVPIEQVKVGDVVRNACGLGKVTEVHHRTAPQLVRVILTDGRIIECTPEHPFFTDTGWVKAIDLTHCKTVYSSCETMRIVRQGIPHQSTNKKVLFRKVPELLPAVSLRAMRKNISAVRKTKEAWANTLFLQPNLCKLVDTRSSRVRKVNYKEMSLLQQVDEKSSQSTRVLFGALPQSTDNKAVQTMWKSVYFSKEINRLAKNSFLQHVLQEESDWSKMLSEKCAANGGGNESLGIVSSVNCSFSRINRTYNKTQPQALVSDRYCIPGAKTCGGNRRRHSSHTGKNKKRQNQDEAIEGTRVACVEILESRGDERFNESAGGYSVHNLEVEGHPSYSVNGVVVHNCKKGSEAVSMSAFVGAKAKRLRHIGDESQFLSGVLSAYSNWFGKKNFKGFICGNPLTLDDGLCTAAEPVDGGWDNWKDNNSTQEWRSKFFNSWVIALDGRDSPNFDYPDTDGPRYDYLVGKKKLDGVSATHGTDSWHWFNQCVGKPKPGMTINRVITKEFCRQHGAHDIAFWQGTTRTLIYGLDPAYGGGDRCVGGMVEFGEGLEGKQILKVHPPEIVPINVSLNMPPEDQIANFIKKRMGVEELNIPVENSFYDSFGKGTLGFSFAHVFGHQTPRPVDFGQKPTDRPVRHDLYVEENGVKRLKRCNEEYSKFVTELWFSVREVIMSNQMRELPHDVMAEGCSREYYIVRGNLTEVEPKEDMKKRLQHSPDLFDWLAVCIEGARQRGFRIETIGLEASKANGQRTDWLAKEQDNYRRDLKKHLPVYS